MPDTPTLLPFPIYLLKRKIKSTFGKVGGLIAGGDGTHWGLRIDGQYYHITIQKLDKTTVIVKDSNIISSNTLVKQNYTKSDMEAGNADYKALQNGAGGVYEKKIGETYVNSDQISRIFDEILAARFQQGADYRLDDNNCRHLAITLWFRISSAPPPAQLRGLLFEAVTAFRSMDFLLPYMAADYAQEVGVVLDTTRAREFMSLGRSGP